MSGVGMLVCFVVFFVGVVIWVFLPSNRHAMRSHGYIPLKEDASDDSAQ
jgi:cbb3-type cytochrome oxidase subunit 3